MGFTVSGTFEPDSADATPISAVRPLLLAAGLVIANLNEPSADLASMSFQPRPRTLSSSR